MLRCQQDWKLIRCGTIAEHPCNEISLSHCSLLRVSEVWSLRRSSGAPLLNQGRRRNQQHDLSTPFSQPRRHECLMLTQLVLPLVCWYPHAIFWISPSKVEKNTCRPRVQISHNMQRMLSFRSHRQHRSVGCLNF